MPLLGKCIQKKSHQTYSMGQLDFVESKIILSILININCVKRNQKKNIIKLINLLKRYLYGKSGNKK